MGVLLIQICTSAGWAEAFTAITADYDCELPNEEMGVKGNCGSFGAGVAFMIAYLVLSFLIIVNMYIAVILENYSQATEDVQEGITDEDYDLLVSALQGTKFNAPVIINCQVIIISNNNYHSHDYYTGRPLQIHHRQCHRLPVQRIPGQ